MDFLKLMQERYTTKHYDASKVVDPDTLAKILECARLSPTSVNCQPYHFYVLTGEAKQKMRESVLDFNLTRYDGASHVIVISSLNKMNEAQLKNVVDQEEADGRLPTADLKAAQDKSRHYFQSLHMDVKHDFVHWTGKQAYIAYTTLIYAAQAYGVDSTSIEGLDYEKADEILDLPSKGETCQIMILLGYRDPNDSNQIHLRPKSRLKTEKLMTFLD